MKRGGSQWPTDAFDQQLPIGLGSKANGEGLWESPRWPPVVSTHTNWACLLPIAYNNTVILLSLKRALRSKLPHGPVSHLELEVRTWPQMLQLLIYMNNNTVWFALQLLLGQGICLII